jgi:hypothetical protein
MALRARSMSCVVKHTTETPENRTTALIQHLAEIQAMRTGALQAELERLTGVPSRSWNRPYLVRKVSWLTQAQQRQASDTVDVPTLAEEVRDQPRSPRLDAPIQFLPAPIRDPRLPKPGTVLVRHYKGLALMIQVEADGFTWNGATYRSLSAVAKAITGDHMSGRFFFGLTRRSRGRK